MKKENGPWCRGPWCRVYTIDKPAVEKGTVLFLEIKVKKERLLLVVYSNTWCRVYTIDRPQ